MYTLFKFSWDTEVKYVVRANENSSTTCIPFDPANTDYQQFKADVLAGAELQDADGTPMTQEEADAFIATLP